MINKDILKYFTMAAWLHGYSEGLDGYEHETLKAKLKEASNMLDYVFKNSVVEDEDEDHE